MNSISEAEDRIFELETKLDSSRLKIHDLATMGTLITSINDIKTILSVVMEMSIRMVDGEVGLIQLCENDFLSSRISWGIDDALIHGLIYKDNLDISTYCYNVQESVIYNDFDKSLPNGPNINSILAVPIKSRARCHGTIVIINKGSEENFNELDLKNLEMLVNFAAVAIDNSILLEQSLQKQRMEQELSIARQVQEAILPAGKCEIDGIEFGMIYKPAKEVGGDFYDVIRIDEKECVLIIGDVSNKGVPAGLVMAATAAIIKSELKNNPEIPLAQLMGNLNHLLCDGIIKSHEMFVTLFVARIDLQSKTVGFCNAGHLPPLYYSAAKDEIVELKSGGTFVGQFPDMPYKEGSLKLDFGDKLFAFTDGLTEAEDINGNFFGTERARQIFLAKKGLPAKQFCENVKEWVDRFREGTKEETFDDFTILRMDIV